MAKVLLVEDDNNLREIYEARLQAEGYEIVSAKDGEEALVVAKAQKPDLVISDIMMPKISGFEMLDILRNTEGLKDVKVIMLTALGQNDDQLRADKLGADRYLVKSQVTLEDIVKVAHELLSGQGDTTATATVTPASSASPAADSTVASPTTDTATTSSDASSAAVSTDTSTIGDIPVIPEPALATPSVDAPATGNASAAKANDSATPATDSSASSPTAALDSSASSSPTTGSSVQTTAQEEATVEAEIENFVAGAEPDAAPAAAPAPAVEPAANTASADTTQPQTTPINSADANTIEPVATPTDTATDTVSQPPANETPEQPVATDVDSSPAPSNEQEDQPTAGLKTSDGSTMSHTKVITPTPSTQKDLSALLAKEEAQPAPATTMTAEPPTTANPTIIPVNIDDSPAPAVKPNPDTAAAIPLAVSPSPVSQPDTAHIDPNSIAL